MQLLTQLSPWKCRQSVSWQACVGVQDVEALQAAIALLAPHTGAMSQSQQARLVAAVGAAGAADQLSALTVTGTTPLLPSAAMLAGPPPAPTLCDRLLALCTVRCNPKEILCLVNQRSWWEAEGRGCVQGSSRAMRGWPRRCWRGRRSCRCRRCSARAAARGASRRACSGRPSYGSTWAAPPASSRLRRRPRDCAHRTTPSRGTGWPHGQCRGDGAAVLCCT